MSEKADIDAQLKEISQLRERVIAGEAIQVSAEQYTSPELLPALYELFCAYVATPCGGGGTYALGHPENTRGKSIAERLGLTWIPMVDIPKDRIRIIHEQT